MVHLEAANLTLVVHTFDQNAQHFLLVVVAAAAAAVVVVVDGNSD